MEQGMQELKEMLFNSLEGAGVLAKLRAELRKHVFDVIDKNKPVAEKRKDKPVFVGEGLVALNLVREFLKYYELDYTLSTLQSEAQVAALTIPPRSKIASGLSLGAQKPEPEEPLLAQLVARSYRDDWDTKPGRGQRPLTERKKPTPLPNELRAQKLSWDSPDDNQPLESPPFADPFGDMEIDAKEGDRFPREAGNTASNAAMLSRAFFKDEAGGAGQDALVTQAPAVAHAFPIPIESTLTTQVPLPQSKAPAPLSSSGGLGPLPPIGGGQKLTPLGELPPLKPTPKPVEEAAGAGPKGDLQGTLDFTTPPREDDAVKEALDFKTPPSKPTPAATNFAQEDNEDSDLAKLNEIDAQLKALEEEDRRLKQQQKGDTQGGVNDFFDDDDYGSDFVDEDEDLELSPVESGDLSGEDNPYAAV